MNDVVQKVTTDLTFHNGVLVPVGTLIHIDTNKVDLTGDTPNIDNPGDAIVNVPVAVAPIGPTGPNPVAPQQVPPGAIQTAAGYVVPGGGLLVAEGSEAARRAAEQGKVVEDDDMSPKRRQAAEGTGDATTAAVGAQPKDMLSGAGENGGLSDAERDELIELRRQRDAGGFGAAKAPDVADQSSDDASVDHAAIVDGTVPEVTARLDGLSPSDLAAVKQAEADGKDRAGVHAAIDEAMAKHDDI